MTPRALATRLERHRRVPPGSELDRFAGYLVVAPFASGHVLALHRVTATSMGPPYSSIAHRDAAGRWTCVVDIEPARASLRYFAGAVSRTVVDDIRVVWSEPDLLHITARRARIDWAVRVGATPATLLASAGVRLLSSPHPPRRLRAALERGVGRLLGAGYVPLQGVTPAGPSFRLNPRVVRRIAATAALVDGRDLGMAGRLRAPLTSGPLRLPEDGLFVMGTGWFK